MEYLILCFTLAFVISALVGFVVIVRWFIRLMTGYPLRGRGRGSCAACGPSALFAGRRCPRCGAAADPVRHDRLTQNRMSLIELAEQYRRGRIPYETYTLLSRPHHDRIAQTLSALWSRRRTLTDMPIVGPPTEAGPTVVEEVPAGEAPAPPGPAAAEEVPPSPEPVPEPAAAVEETKEAEAEAAPEPSVVGPPEEAPPAPPSPVVEEMEGVEAAAVPSKWPEVLSKTLFFLGGLSATATAFLILVRHQGAYHPIYFSIFAGLTLVIFGMALVAKHLIGFPWAALTFSLLTAVLTPVNYLAACAFEITVSRDPVLEWGLVGIICSGLYVGAARLARQRTLLFLAALVAPAGLAMILKQTTTPDGLVAMLLCTFAAAYIARAHLLGEDRFRAPTLRIAAYTIFASVPVFLLVFWWLGSADLGDLSLGGYGLFGFCLFWGLLTGVIEIHYATATLFSLAGIFALAHFSRGHHNPSPFLMGIGWVLVGGDLAFRKVVSERGGRPFGHLAICIAAVALLMNLREVPPFLQQLEHTRWSIFLGAALLTIYFIWKTRDALQGAYMGPAFMSAYAFLAFAIHVFGWPWDLLWIVALGLGLVATGVRRLRPGTPEGEAGEMIGLWVTPYAAIGAAGAALLDGRPEVYPLVALPVAGAHALACAIWGRRPWQTFLAGGLLALIPLFVMMQLGRPWYESPGYLFLGAAALHAVARTVARRWGGDAGAPLVIYSIGLSLLGILFGASVLIILTLAEKAIPDPRLAPLWLGVAGAGAFVLHATWARRYSHGWQWAPANAGLLMLLFAAVQHHDLSGHLYALLPVALGVINAAVSKAGGDRFRVSLRVLAIVLVGLPVVIYAPTVYLLSVTPGWGFPVATALLAALGFAIVARGSVSPWDARAAVSMVFLAHLFMVTLNEVPGGWETMFAAFALLACGLGILWEIAWMVRWGRAAVETAVAAVAITAMVILAKVIAGSIPAGVAAIGFLICALTLGVSGLIGPQGWSRRPFGPFLVGGATITLIGAALSGLAWSGLTLPSRGFLLPLLALLYLLSGVISERRKVPWVHIVFYGAVGIVVVISTVFVWGTVTESFWTSLCYAAVFGLGSYMVKREVFFYAAAMAFSIGFLFLMKRLGVGNLTVAMWEAALAIGYVVAGRVFFVERPWRSDPLLLVAILIALGVVMTFVGSGREVLEAEGNLLTAISTSLILAALFAVMARTARAPAFYALTVLMVLSAYYLALRYFHAVYTEWYTWPPALLAAGVGVWEMKRKVRVVMEEVFPEALVVIGLLIFYAPAFYRSLDPELRYEGVLIAGSSGLIVLLTTFRIRVKVLLWGGVVVFFLNLIVQAYHRVPWAAIPREVWMGVSAVIFISAAFVLESRFRARVKSEIAEVRERMDRFFTDWD